MVQVQSKPSSKGTSRLGRTIRSLGVSVALYLGIVVVLTFSLARWPTVAGAAVFMVVFGLVLLRFVESGFRLKFSLRTVGFATGLVACVIALLLTPAPWTAVHRFPGYEANIALSADGRLVAASQGTSIEIRETQSGLTVQTIKMPAIEAAKKMNQRWAYKMRFTKDGTSLMTVDWHTSACLLDVATGAELRQWPPNSGICPIALSGDRFMATSNTGNLVETCGVYDIERVEPILSIESTYPFCRFISPAGSHVLVGKNQTTAELWNVEEVRLVGTIPISNHHPVYSFGKFTQDGKMLAVTTSTGVAVWDVATCQKVADWNPPKFDHLTSLEWSPDGSRFVASYVEMIGPTTGPAVAAAAAAGTLPRNAIEHSFLLDQNCQEMAPIRGQGAAFSPTGDRIATICPHLQVFDAKTGELLTAFIARSIDTIHGNSPIQFSADGDWLVVNGDATVYRRTRSEFWYGIYQIPAFWGIVLFIAAVLVHLQATWVALGGKLWKQLRKTMHFSPRDVASPATV